jgi:hypothetical protein
MVRESGFCGDDGGIVELNAVAVVDTMLRYNTMDKAKVCPWADHLLLS